MDADNAARYRRLKVSTRCLSASPDGKLPDVGVLAIDRELVLV